MTRPALHIVQTDAQRDEVLRLVARELDRFDPIKSQAEIDREAEIEAYRRAYRLAAVATFCAVHRAPPGPDRWKFRSRTFEGVAEACADQWGGWAATALEAAE